MQTRLSLLDQHLALLIESTENCGSLTGESVVATLFIIQEQVRQLLLWKIDWPTMKPWISG